jgi:hypothetical protein
MTHPDVPAAQEWMYFEHDPSSPERSGGPVLMRYRSDAVERTYRATERALADRGVTARCGEDEAHELACYLPDGEPVPAPYTPRRGSGCAITHGPAPGGRAGLLTGRRLRAWKIPQSRRSSGGSRARTARAGR